MALIVAACGSQPSTTASLGEEAGDPTAPTIDGPTTTIETATDDQVPTTSFDRATTTDPGTAPPIDVTVEAGVASNPQFPVRAGDLDLLGVDLPVPDGWEASSSQTRAASAITGRGRLFTVRSPVDSNWLELAMVHPDDTLVSGPTSIAVPLYARNGESLATTGRSLSVNEYQYDSTSFAMSTVWRWRDGDEIVLVVLGFPDPAKVPESLTGLDPRSLLDDVRILELD